MSQLLNIFYHRKLRNIRYLVRTGLIAGYLLLMTLMLPRSYRYAFEYEPGKPWTADALQAPYDFAVLKTEAEIRQDQERIRREMQDIYVRDTALPGLVRERVRAQLGQWSGRILRLLEAEEQGGGRQAEELRAGLEEELGTPLPPGLRRAAAPDTARLRSLADAWTERCYRQGVLRPRSPDSLGEYILLRFAVSGERYQLASAYIRYPEGVPAWFDSQSQTAALSPLERLLLRSALAAQVQPDVAWSEDLTRRELARRMGLISPSRGMVHAQDWIVRKDQIVDREVEAKLLSLKQEQEARMGPNYPPLAFLSQFLVILLITSILLSYLSINRPRIYFSNTKLSLLLFTMLLTMAAIVTATKLSGVALKVVAILGPNIDLEYIYLAPACIVPIFISNFFDHRTGFLCNLLTALYGAVLVQRGLEFAFVQLIAGTVVLFSLRQLRKREMFFFSLGYLLLAYVAAYLIYSLYYKGNLADISYPTLLLFVLNVAITAIAYNLIYLFERIFGITSDLTFLELLDTNHPLLQELQRKAPGTFQHSLQVANIAEATINEIGGNALLVHVGALYHDIGKMIHPKYFIENMSEEERLDNPHQHLDCRESAEIIIGHVRKGVEMAQKYHLPQEVVYFIETHHGTTRVEYFFRRYLRERMCEEAEADSLFRYPGPLPFSKETAVLMIADSVEAASRSMHHYTPDKIRDLVNGIIDFKIKDNQLENSSLTFKDISIIRRVMTRQLMNIYHSRIEYPKEQQAAAEGSSV